MDEFKKCEDCPALHPEIECEECIEIHKQNILDAYDEISTLRELYNWNKM